MLIVAAFPDAEAGARATAAIRSHFSAELYSRERVTIPGDDEPADAPGDFVARAAVAGAILGAGISLVVQWWSASIAYPLDIGGRPSPAFFSYIPAAVAVGMFWSALAAFLAFLWACGLSRLRHPLFEADSHGLLAEGGSLVGIKVQPDEAAAAERLAREFGAVSIDRVDA